MAKKSHSLHIKRHTAGTSNELSLDVLDAARDELDSQKTRKGTKSFMLDFRRKPGDKRSNDAARPTTDKPQKGTHTRDTSLSSSAGESRGRSKGIFIPKGPSLTNTGNRLMPADEVLRKKKARRRSALRSRFLIIGGVLVALGVLIFFGYQNYQEQQGFNQEYRALVSEISSADPYLVELDGMMDDPLGQTTSDDRARARKKAVAITSAADSVDKKAEELRASAPSDPDKIALDQLIKGADGRVSMVGLTMEAFDIADDASAVRESAEATWSQVVNTDISARDAIAAANDATTASSLEETSSTLRIARDEFAAAREKLVGIESAVDNIDFSPQTAFLDKRIEALDAALATNDALAVGDRGTAAEQNELYNAADSESAELAEKLPQSIGTVVDEAFKDDILSVQSRYDSERQRVAEADSLVRRYLRG